MPCRAQRAATNQRRAVLAPPQNLGDFLLRLVYRRSIGHFFYAAGAQQNQEAAERASFRILGHLFSQIFVDFDARWSAMAPEDLRAFPGIYAQFQDDIERAIVDEDFTLRPTVSGIGDAPIAARATRLNSSRARPAHPAPPILLRALSHAPAPARPSRRAWHWLLQFRQP